MSSLFTKTTKSVNIVSFKKQRGDNGIIHVPIRPTAFDPHVSARLQTDGKIYMDDRYLLDYIYIYGKDWVQTLYGHQIDDNKLNLMLYPNLKVVEIDTYYNRSPSDYIIQQLYLLGEDSDIKIIHHGAFKNDDLETDFGNNYVFIIDWEAFNDYNRD